MLRCINILRNIIILLKVGFKQKFTKRQSNLLITNGKEALIWKNWKNTPKILPCLKTPNVHKMKKRDFIFSGLPLPNGCWVIHVWWRKAFETKIRRFVAFNDQWVDGISKLAHFHNLNNLHKDRSTTADTKKLLSSQSMQDKYLKETERDGSSTEQLRSFIPERETLRNERVSEG